MKHEAIAIEHTHKNIDETRGSFATGRLSSLPNASIAGAVSFGSYKLHRLMIVDDNYELDVELAGTPYVARLENPLTEYENGFVSNATLMKFNPETGVMWLAEGEDEYGNIVWGHHFRFRHMNLNHECANGRLEWVF